MIIENVKFERKNAGPDRYFMALLFPFILSLFIKTPWSFLLVFFSMLFIPSFFKPKYSKEVDFENLKYLQTLAKRKIRNSEEIDLLKGLSPDGPLVEAMVQENLKITQILENNKEFIESMTLTPTEIEAVKKEIQEEQQNRLTQGSMSEKISDSISSAQGENVFMRTKYKFVADLVFFYFTLYFIFCCSESIVMIFVLWMEVLNHICISNFGFDPLSINSKVYGAIFTAPISIIFFLVYKMLFNIFISLWGLIFGYIK
jgi:hypothetical protein